MPGCFLLKDGTCFHGTRFGSRDPVVGEIALYTGVVGWQEVLTDPAYAGKIVVFTYPHVGNYGVNEEDVESSDVTVKGIVVRELARFYSNFRAQGDFRSWVEAKGIAGLTGVDTRAVMVHVRDHGDGIAAIAANELEAQKVMREAGSPFDRNLVAEVQRVCLPPETGRRGDAETGREVDAETRGRWDAESEDAETRGRGDAEIGIRQQATAISYQPSAFSTQHSAPSPQHPAPSTQHSAPSPQHPAPSTQHSALRTQDSGLSTHDLWLAALDLGGKYSLYRQFADLGCSLHLFPWDTDAETILASGASGLLLPPGPGDPNQLGAAVKQIRRLLGKLPILGIGLGFQLLAMALGAQVVRLKAGRHGVNYPICSTRRAPSLIAACHHSFAVDAETIPAGVAVTYTHLNEGTTMGIEAAGLNAWGYQFHPSRDGDNRPSPLLARFVESCLVSQESESGSRARGTDPTPGPSPTRRGEQAGFGVSPNNPPLHTPAQMEDADHA